MIKNVVFLDQLSPLIFRLDVLLVNARWQWLGWLVGWSPGSLQSGLWCCLSRSTARGSGFGRSFSCWNWFWWSSLCCTRPTQMALFQPRLVESTLCCRKRHKTAVLLGNFFFNRVWGGTLLKKEVVTIEELVLVTNWMLSRTNEIRYDIFWWFGRFACLTFLWFCSCSISN